MIMFGKRFNALSDLPLTSIFGDIIKKLDLFYTYCLEIVNALTEQLKANEYYLTNPKLDFLMNLLCEQIEKRDQNARDEVILFH